MGRFGDAANAAAASQKCTRTFFLSAQNLSMSIFGVHSASGNAGGVAQAAKVNLSATRVVLRHVDVF